MDFGKQMEQMDNMSDEQLKSMAQAAGAMNPMMANMDPGMMRQAMNMMKNMSPEQQASMADMAKSGQMPGMGGMGGGMPPQQPAPVTQSLEHEDYKSGVADKEAATILFKAGDFQAAGDKFHAAINCVRLSDIKSEP